MTYFKDKYEFSIIRYLFYQEFKRIRENGTWQQKKFNKHLNRLYQMIKSEEKFTFTRVP